MELLTSPDKVKDYFKSVCDRYTAATLTFYEQTGSAIGNNLKYPACIMMPVATRLVDNKSANIHRLFEWEVWIVKDWTKGDFETMKTILAETDSIAIDLVSMIKHEWMDLFPVTERPVKQFDLNSIQTLKIDPQGSNNAIGTALMGNFMNPINPMVKFDATKWA